MPMDLVPFGFTPTESMVYAALVDCGPSSAYSLSKTTAVARANVYQALNGLVSKGAAKRVSKTPQIFRPTGPASLLAMVAERETAKLDLLEAQISTHGQIGAEATFSFESERSFKELALRLAVRASRVMCIATAAVLSGLTPIWRKRHADQAQTDLWVVGDEPQGLSIPLTGTVAPETVRRYFSTDLRLLLTPDAAMLGLEPSDGQLSGYWSSDPLWMGAIRGTADAITGA